MSDSTPAFKGNSNSDDVILTFIAKDADRVACSERNFSNFELLRRIYDGIGDFIL